MTTIVMGMAGGIAAFKACHLIRIFREAGDSVRVVPTTNALEFVGAATFEALSGQPVTTSVYTDIDRVQHVRVGQDAELIVIAPATADLIARIAAGRADDLLTATLLVATCPVVIAPAMHTEMWLNQATQDNVATLRRRGIIVLDPANGRLTGQDSGPGRMLEPSQIAELAWAVKQGASLERDWEGRRVVITAGGTQEPLDPVRYLGNRSSGRQGFALAEIAGQRGASVDLIAGVTDDLPTPANTRITRITSAHELDEAVRALQPGADALIAAAAVADFRPAQAAGAKLKKGSDNAALASIELVENPDVLRGAVMRREPGQVIAGFAAETGDERATALEYGMAKLRRKGCDLMMCNEVGVGKVFGETRNRGWLLSAPGGEIEVSEVSDRSKLAVAAELLTALGKVRN